MMDSSFLSKAKVVERHYWTLRLTDKFRPKGEYWPEHFATKEEAEAFLDNLVKKELVIRETDEQNHSEN